MMTTQRTPRTAAKNGELAAGGLGPLLAPASSECGPDDAVAGMALVRQIAASIARRLPSHVDREELISLGALGWAQARCRFDATRGVPFAGFAAARIRGAILDGLRQSDSVSRGERRRAKESAVPTPQRIVCDPSELAYALSIAVSEEDPTEEMARRQSLADLHRALSTLTEREWFIINRHFFDEQPMRAVGAELGVTESRISQIVSGALCRLRNAMEHPAETPVVPISPSDGGRGAKRAMRPRVRRIAIAEAA
jgi:RNA polymerase sigma factor for flagellar operon FliA